MGFLRRLLGQASPDAPVGDADPAATESEERERERDLLREDRERLDDLAQRQLRYAAHAWRPPAEGGVRRADDADRPAPDGT